MFTNLIVFNTVTGDSLLAPRQINLNTPELCTALTAGQQDSPQREKDTGDDMLLDDGDKSQSIPSLTGEEQQAEDTPMEEASATATPVAPPRTTPAATAPPPVTPAAQPPTVTTVTTAAATAPPVATPRDQLPPAATLQRKQLQLSQR